MAIWPFQGKNSHTVHVNSYFNLDELEYAFEFSDDEGILLERAYDNQQRGGVFHVPKQTGFSGSNGQRNSQSAMKSIAQIEYCPTREDMTRLFEDEYGGGRSITQVTRPSRQICTYSLRIE